MDLNLASMYGTPGADAVSEEYEKTAQAELFAKLAADEGINLNNLDDEQISELWGATFGEKLAGEKCEECDKVDCECPAAEKTSAAQEFAAEKEYQEKVAEADYLGRVMAHSYVQELGDIGDGIDKEARMGLTEAGMRARHYAKNPRAAASEAYEGAKATAKRLGPAIVSAAKGEKFRAGRKRIAGAGAEAERKMYTPTNAARFGRKTNRATGKMKNLIESAGRKERNRGAKETGGLIAGLGAAGGGAAYATRDKGASINELAFDEAIYKVAQAGWDPEECAERIGSVFTLGLFDEENTKIAAADDVEGAIEIRSLEMLESAGYEVNWG